MNYDVCVKKFSQWIKDVRKRYCKNMIYVFVPELHKSGRFHFHGIMSACDGLEFIDSGHVDDKGRVIYNIGRYKLGFTTATKVTDSRKVNKYISKYVTKELSAVTKGKRRYWHSKNCRVPEIEYFYNKPVYNDDRQVVKDTDTVLRELHDDLISRSGFVMGQEKEYIDSQGRNQYIRYYEYQEG
jgi:hypothetical protein